MGRYSPWQKEKEAGVRQGGQRFWNAYNAMCAQTPGSREKVT